MNGLANGVRYSTIGKLTNERRFGLWRLVSWVIGMLSPMDDAWFESLEVIFV
jgi:hypothetical protein